MRIPLASISTCILTAGLAAQGTSPVLKADRTANVYANSTTRGASSFVGGRLLVSASNGGVAATTAASFGRGLGTTTHLAEIREGGGNRSPLGGAGSAGTGTSASTKQSHAWTYTIPAAKGGKLGISIGGAAFVTGGGVATAAATVTVGTASAIRWNTGQRPILVTVSNIATASLTVKIQTSGSALAAARQTAVYDMSVGMIFTPGSGSGGCTILRGDASCRQGGALSASVRTLPIGVSQIHVTLAGATLRNAFGLFVVSDQRKAVKFGALGCIGFTRPLILLPMKTDARGGASISFAVPRNTVATGWAQAVTVGGSGGLLQIFSSNTLGASCR